MPGARYAGAGLVAVYLVLHSLVGIHCLPVTRKHGHSKKVLEQHHKLEYAPNEQTDWFSQQDTSKEFKPNHKTLSMLPVLRNTSSKIAQWNPRRCGVPDFPVQADGRNRQKRFVLSGGRWHKTHLTYKIVRFPWQQSKAKVKKAIADAMKIWSDVTPLTFKEVSDKSGRADIVIDFSRYWHGDNLPFDGLGGILAHAFFPKTHREGDVHFDYDEMWTIGSKDGTDLLQVAAHEFGHVLGLQHSNVPKSLMSPFYTFRYPLSLHEDDKQGIQSLYGAPRSAHTKTAEKYPEGYPKVYPQDVETNDIPNVTPDACDTDFDAVSMIRGELFFFKSQFVWRLRDGHLQAGYPALASRHWQGIPDRVDAAFEDPSGNIWFFQGSRYWVYDGEKRVSGPAMVTHLGLPNNDIRAAVMLGPEKAKKIYFFKDGGYWRFSTHTNHIENVHPRSMADWRGIPPNIDAVFENKQGYTHFLSGKYYWMFDPIHIKVLDGYPRLIGPDFFGCESKTINNR
ncbi:stromelysin-3 [Protopterus annectens]|uniref:stromelysin-3 n=1 Tax=Protopterus annectens TaxID=7888 RepID=UPI001CFA0CBD|nr:stromelysin-3 [Protopterus annectens]